MASRRSQITMSDSEIEAYLADQRVLNVATIGPSGHPHVVAMWYAYVDGELCFWTFAKSQKIANLRRDAKMTALVESGHDYSELRGVEIVGMFHLRELVDANRKEIASLLSAEHGKVLGDALGEVARGDDVSLGLNWASLSCGRLWLGAERP